MKYIFKRCTAALIAGTLAVSLCACSSGKSQNTEENSTQTEQSVNENVQIELSDNSVITFPKELYDKLTVQLDEYTDELIRVYETKSYEQSLADNNYEAGFIFSIGRCDQDGYNEKVLTDIPGLRFIAKSGDWYYYCQQPTDVQYYRSNSDSNSGDASASDDEFSQWSDICSQCDDIINSFAQDNGFSAMDDTQTQEYIKSIVVGTWSLDTDRNDFTALYEWYGSSLHTYGASMEIGSNGEISYYIGASGGTGTYTINGVAIDAKITDDNSGVVSTLSSWIVFCYEDGDVLLYTITCGRAAYWTKDGNGSSQTTETDEITASSSGESDQQGYDALISLYAKALDEKWDDIKLEDNNIGTVYAQMDDPIGQVGYALKDINGDGSDELLIGDKNGDIIFEMYTLSGGEAVKVFEGWYRNAFYLLSDGSILNVASNSAYSDWNMIYKFDGTSLTVQGGVLYDGQYDQDNPWFAHSSDQWDASGDSPLSQEEAQKLIDEYQDSVVSVSMSDFTN